ncbi:hypothetical protein BVI2075_710014 [Burkholderia vietnamiensis]|nr:hypothetical protein BVI1335_1540010 [Burkholderia vietnamiensis]CAG9219319.1 hypothetical protein BVI2075_710014 [Burkholderia vietnamiensis]
MKGPSFDGPFVFPAPVRRGGAC